MSRINYSNDILIITVPLTDLALLVKLYYQNNDNTATAVRRFGTLKNLRNVRLVADGLLLMVSKFKHDSSLCLKTGRRETCSVIASLL